MDKMLNIKFKIIERTLNLQAEADKNVENYCQKQC